MAGKINFSCILLPHSHRVMWVLRDTAVISLFRAWPLCYNRNAFGRGLVVTGTLGTGRRGGCLRSRYFSGQRLASVATLPMVNEIGLVEYQEGG